MPHTIHTELNKVALQRIIFSTGSATHSHQIYFRSMPFEQEVFETRVMSSNLHAWRVIQYTTKLEPEVTGTYHPRSAARTPPMCLSHMAAAEAEAAAREGDAGTPVFPHPSTRSTKTEGSRGGCCRSSGIAQRPVTVTEQLNFAEHPFVWWASCWNVIEAPITITHHYPPLPTITHQYTATFTRRGVIELACRPMRATSSTASGLTPRTPWVTWYT
jgi:hypothetical protein